MKVLVAHVAYRQRGGEDAVFENEQALLRGAGVDVVTLALRNETINEQGWAGRVRIGAATLWSRSGYRKTAALLRRERPDIVHFHNTFPLLSPSAYAACADAGIPVVQTLHNFRLICAAATLFRNGAVCERCVGKPPLPALRHRCYRDSLAATAAVVSMQLLHRAMGTFRRRVDRYLALTAFAKARLVQGGLPAERIIVKPNFLPDPPVPAEGAGGYALFVGRISEEKGVRLLLDAWMKVDGLPLRVAGDGPLLAEMRKKAAVQSGRVTLLGGQSQAEVRSLMAAAAFVVIPSIWYEGFPMVLLEAFASAKPVLCSRLGSLDELVCDGVTGRKFKAGCPDDLARAVAELMRDREALQQMGRRAREVFEQRYTETVARQALLDIYEDLLRERGSQDAGPV